MTPCSVQGIPFFLNSNLELEHLFFVDGFGYEGIEKVTQISEVELKKVSTLKTPNNVLALFIIRNWSSLVLIIFI